MCLSVAENVGLVLKSIQGLCINALMSFYKFSCVFIVKDNLGSRVEIVRKGYGLCVKGRK